MNNDEERDTTTTTATAAATTTAVDLINNATRFYGWPSSRIVRVSRASGGKDRHSKVLTSKGLRDRRVRLSVNTAIQFYDLQDRLGYDQPSKAVEWLLKAAASSIDELPPISAPAAFCEVISRQGSDDKSNGDGSDQLGFEEDVVMDGGGGDGAAVSSNSENSKGSSGLSLSRSESRIKARERAKGRVAGSGSKFRSREKENETMNPSISQTTSFTELLSGGITNVPNGTTSTNHDMFQKAQRPWTATPMEYYATGLLTPPQFSMAEDHNNYSFVPENLNFTISSSATNAGFNRGTLQSNSSSSPSNLLPHFQRFDGSSPSFLISPAVENHHQFLYGFDGRLNGNNGRHSDHREGKGKN